VHAIITEQSDTCSDNDNNLADIDKLGIGQEFSHLSTGGGATLEFIEFGTLPGIDALSNKE
jgi:phosphoglycerate kinase